MVDAVITVNDVTTRTDSAGSALATAPLGEIRITVKKGGYFPATISDRVDTARENTFHIDLEAQETRKEEIRESEHRTDTSNPDYPLHVEVLEREEIEEKMMMTPGDIVMMLNEMGGMRVQTTSPPLGAASVRVQGMLGRYTSFLSDSLPIFGQQGAGLGLLQIPPIDLAQVEVIKGNASALYGGAAMAGLGDLNSRPPSTEPIHEL